MHEDEMGTPAQADEPQEGRSGLTRRRLIQRGALFAGATTVAAGLLAACGDDDDGGTTSDAAPGSSAAAPASSEAAPASSAEGGSSAEAPGSSAEAPASSAGGASSAPAISKPVTISLWTWAWPEADQGGDDYVAAFKEAEPNITLEIKKYPFPDYLTALRTGVPNGTAGEVLHLQTGSLLAQYAQFLQPLDELAARDWGGDWASGFFPAATKEIADSVPAGTPTLALPQQYSVGGVLFYNKALFEAAGLSAPPQTYDEWLAAVPKFEEAGMAPSIWGAKDQWPNTDWLIQFSSQWKPGIVEMAEKGEASFADDAIVQALNFMKGTLDQGIWNKSPFATAAFPDAYGLFQGGKAASAAAGSWGYPLMGAEPADKDAFGAMLWPALPGAPGTDTINGLASGAPTPGGPNAVRPWRTVNVAASVRSGLDAEKTEAAWRFVEFFCSEEGQKIAAGTFTPARPGVEIPGLSAEWTANNEWVNSLGDVAERREFTYSDTRTAIQDAIQNVCVNGADPAEELAKVDEAAAKAREDAA